MTIIYVGSEINQCSEHEMTEQEQKEMRKLIPGCEFLPGLASGADNYIEDGEVKPKPSRPSEWHFWDYTINEWAPSAVIADKVARGQRNRLLIDSDWTQLPDVPVQTKAEWALYRQQLRDLTAQPGYPLNIDWPVPPSN